MLCSIIIPCFNEEDNIKRLVDRMENAGENLPVEWIIVENGSEDNTRSLLRQYCSGKEKIKIVYVDQNRGYGFGLINGIRQAKGDYIGWIHADMQISLNEVVRFIRHAERNKMKNVFYKGRRKDRPFLDRVFTGGMSVFASILFHTFLYDINGLPILFDRELLEKLKNMPYDFSIDAYVYYMAKKEHYRIFRYPVSVKQRDRGKSSWNTGFLSRIRQSLIIMKDLVMIRRGKRII